ncbi:hypothetical protein [Fulvivirga lutea]|uniref:Uncharacterized protein n=1 Tax=Fulvivirga lutea TaxID=2810512 RepID=A0A974WEL0_9BACT|nr:hypothetical protein [Fulvivirga lutea]QSE96691.1 hypothetical protein JR347_13955 [Fulvivirga lutea]
MKLIEKLRCSFKTSYKEYYKQLSADQLIQRRKSLKKQYLAPAIAWIVSFGIILFSGLEFEIMILFAGSVFGTVAMLYEDYRKRLMCIDEILKGNN